MKRGLMIGGGILAVIVVVIVVAVVFIAANLDSLVKKGVESYGPTITKTTVTLAEVDIDATSGKGALRGLVIGNPAGFKTDSAFRLGEVKVHIDISSVTSDPVIIKEIVISQPEITYELGGGGANNMSTIQKNVDSFVAAQGGGKSGGSGGSSGGTGASDTGASDTGNRGESGGPKMIIENIYVRGGKVAVSATFLGGRKLTVPLPELHLKNIGKDKGGATPGEVAKRLMKEIGGAVDSAAKNSLGGIGKGADEAKKLLQEGTDGVGGKLKKLFGR